MATISIHLKSRNQHQSCLENPQICEIKETILKYFCLNEQSKRNQEIFELIEKKNTIFENLLSAKAVPTCISRPLHAYIRKKERPTMI